MKPDETEKRLKNALIYGTSHPEAYMTKADELWEKYADDIIDGCTYMDWKEFEAALKEYGEHFRSEAVKVCLEVNTDRMPSPSLEGFTVTNSGLGCASVISKMELP